MTDEKFVETVPLEAPFEDRWVKVNTQPKMKIWMGARGALGTVLDADRLEDGLNAILDAIAPIIVDHNLVDVDTGERLRLEFGEMTAGQIKGVLDAVTSVVIPEGAEPADPPPAMPEPGNRETRRRRRTSPKTSSSSSTPSSPRTPYRQTSRSSS